MAQCATWKAGTALVFGDSVFFFFAGFLFSCVPTTARRGRPSALITVYCCEASGKSVFYHFLMVRDTVARSKYELLHKFFFWIPGIEAEFLACVLWLTVCSVCLFFKKKRRGLGTGWH